MSYTPAVGLATTLKPGLVQLAGDLGGSGTTATAPILAGYAKATGGGAETVVTANTGTSYQINLASGNVFNLTATGNPTFTFTGATAGKACSFALYLKQDATGSRVATWPGSVKWAGATGPTLSTSANAVDILVFESIDGGTTWFGSLVGAAFA